MELVPYNATLKKEWDNLVELSRNGTFLLKRDYMDYHADRFTDASVMIYDRRNKPVAILPASAHDREIRSHGGLTYGGWILAHHHPNAAEMMDAWQLAIDYYRQGGFDTLLYKPVPYIYHRYPAQDEIYGLWRLGGGLEVVNTSSTIDLRNPESFNSSSRTHLNHANKAGVKIEFATELNEYWQILTDLLLKKYGTAPVHSLDEITRLRTLFPDNIQLLVALDPVDGSVIAGILFYITDNVAHSQYIASTTRGRELYSIPLLVSHAAKIYARRCLYLDLGTSNEDSGRCLNTTLLNQKSGFGALGVVYPHYRLRF